MNLFNSYRIQKLYLMKIASFISSMIPLSVFLVLKYYNNYEIVMKYIPVNILVNSIFGITILSLIYIICFFKILIPKGNFNRNIYRMENIVQERTSTSTYLLSNVLPVVALGMDYMYNIVFLVVLILFLSFMYIKNNMYYINPIYDLINIKVYKADVFENGNRNLKNIFIISCITLYGFENTDYEGIKFGDILIINKNVN